MISKRIRFVSLISVILLALSAGVWWTVAYFNEASPVNEAFSEYALLVFGPEAKTRVWVVARGQTLEIHSDGNLTGPAEYVEVDQNGSKDWKNIEIEDSDGKTRYVITGMSLISEELRRQMGWGAGGAMLGVDVDIQGINSYHQFGDLELKESPDQASIAHFHGPLKIEIRKINGEIPKGAVLRKGEKPSKLNVTIGTFDHEKGCWVVVRTENEKSSAFPEGVFPRAEIEFPTKTPEQPPLKREFTLDYFC